MSYYSLGPCLHPLARLSKSLLLIRENHNNLAYPELLYSNVWCIFSLSLATRQQQEDERGEFDFRGTAHPQLEPKRGILPGTW
jgi:hypothetical protein